MKAIEMPVKMTIMVVFAIIILIGMIAFFGNVWNPSTQQISLIGAKEQACSVWVSGGCSENWSTVLVKNFGDISDLKELYEKKYNEDYNNDGAKNEADMKEICNCP